MSVAVAPKRLGWWFAAEADRPAGLHARYVVAAGFLGVLWNFVLFVIPFTNGPFTYHPTEATARDHLITTVALVLTSSVISTLFRRTIVRARPLLVPIVATVVMLLGAALFETAWMHFLALDRSDPWASIADYLVDVFQMSRYGIEMAISGFWVTVPMATLHLFALRAVARKSVARVDVA